jgi:hypothetical protein
MISEIEKITTMEEQIIKQWQWLITNDPEYYIPEFTVRYLRYHISRTFNKRELNNELVMLAQIAFIIMSEKNI